MNLYGRSIGTEVEPVAPVDPAALLNVVLEVPILLGLKPNALRRRTPRSATRLDRLFHLPVVYDLLIRPIRCLREALGELISLNNEAGRLHSKQKC